MLQGVILVMLAGCANSNDPVAVNCALTDLQLQVSSFTHPTDCTTPNGMIIVEATGGKPPYQYRLNTGIFGLSASFSGLGAGAFIITVKDQQGCEKEVTVNLSVNTGLTASVSAQNPNSNCLAPYNGSVSVAASGGSGNYQFSINGSPFSATSDFSGLKDGIHNITVKDLSDNCTFSLSVNIPRAPTGITYTGQVKTLLEAKCSGVSCHPANGDLFTYAGAFARRQQIKTRTQNGSMPPPGSGSLTADEKALIACWVDDGAPQD
jgi:hypothetical protein